MTDRPTPKVHVTPWSKEPTKAYEPVAVEFVAVLDVQLALMLFTKPNGYSMAVEINPVAVDYLVKRLAEIQRRFKAHRKETV